MVNSVFETLSSIDVSKHVDTVKSGNTELKYLSWVHAWAGVVKHYPDATYEVIKQPSGLPYVYDDKTGYMVNTRVTMEGLTHEMWLFVMDGANKAMKSQSYQYEGWGYENGQRKRVQKTVEAASMFDINKTIMRCLVKNLAMFGYGINVYAGEDLPMTIKTITAEQRAELCSKYGENSVAYFESQNDTITEKPDSDLMRIDNWCQKAAINFHKEECRKALERRVRNDSSFVGPHINSSIKKHLQVNTLDECQDLGLLKAYYAYTMDKVNEGKE